MRARYADVAESRTGRPLPGVTVWVYDEGTTNPIAGPIYASPTGPATLANPFQTNAQGEIVFYLDTPLRVDLQWSGTVTPEVETVDALAARPPASTVEVGTIAGMTADNVQAALAELKAGETGGGTGLAAETAARIAADSAEASTRASAVTAEATARASADTAEATARAVADALLIPLAQKGAALGVAILGADSKVPGAQLPELAINETFVVASQAAMLALTAQRGDMAVRTDISQTFVLTADAPTILGNWVALETPSGTTAAVAAEAALRAAADALLIPLTQKAAANGVATLDGSATVPDAQIPATIARDAETTAAVATETTNRTAADAAHAASAVAHSGTTVLLTGDQSIAGVKKFRDGFTSRTIAGDTAYGGILMRSIGDTSSGIVDWLHNGDGGYLLHMTMGALTHRPWACIGLGSDYDSNGLLTSNKGTGNGYFCDNQATVSSATGAGHGIHGKQSTTDASASLIYLQAAVDGAGPLLVLDASTAAPTAGQLLIAFTGPSSTLWGQVKAVDGTLDWRAPISTTSYVKVNGGAAAAKSYINADAGQQRDLDFQTANSSRWSLRTDGTAEGGADAGSDFVIVSRTDAGATKTSVLKITRSSGLVTLANGLTVTGALIASATAAITGAATVGGTLGVTGTLTAVDLTTTGTLQSSGTLQVVKTTATAQALITATAGQARELSFQSAGSSRWTLRCDTAAESGSDVGSDLALVSRTDGGATKTIVLKITRSTGLIALLGTLSTMVSAAAGAGLRLPHGAAPTSPVNGDMWTTTAGLFVQINGVTKTVTLT